MMQHIAVHIVLSINSAATLPVIHMYIYNDEYTQIMWCYVAVYATVAAIGLFIAVILSVLTMLNCMLRRSACGQQQTKGTANLDVTSACNTARSMHKGQ
eukprot:12067-Heterococcus_DN1.PRE.2